MQPASLPLQLYRGDTFRVQITLSDQNNVPLDLTGVVADSEIRDRPAGSIIVPLQCAVVLPNIVNLTLLAADSQNLPPQGVWDLKLTYPSGDVATPLAGSVTVTPDVTDSTP